MAGAKKVGKSCSSASSGQQFKHDKADWGPVCQRTREKSRAIWSNLGNKDCNFFVHNRRRMRCKMSRDLELVLVHQDIQNQLRLDAATQLAYLEYNLSFASDLTPQ